MKCLTSLIAASWKGCQTPAGERSPLVFSCLACRVCVVTLSWRPLVISFSVLIRVGAASSPEEIAAWPDVDYNKKARSWARLLNLMLDPLQGAYRSEDVPVALLHPEPNDAVPLPKVRNPG